MAGRRLLGKVEREEVTAAESSSSLWRWTFSFLLLAAFSDAFVVDPFGQSAASLLALSIGGRPTTSPTILYSTQSPFFSFSPPSSAPSSSSSTFSIKHKILQLGALTDRGKLQDPLIAKEGLYSEEKDLVISLIQQLIQSQKTPMDAKQLEGDWELVYSTRQLFRSSPFFQAIAKAYNNTEKSELFFRLHELQTCSWGASQIGRVAQKISLSEQSLYSEFDTVLFPITALPIIGFWKLLPTFGGRIISIAQELIITKAKGGKEVVLDYELAKTSFKKVKNLGVLPGLGSLMEKREFPVKQVWEKLPWNGGRGPTCSIRVRYLDADFRINEDESGGYFVYTRPLL